MPEVVVVNKVKDRCKLLKNIGNGEFEYGWMVYNRRGRGHDYFNSVGVGTYEDAIKWMNTDTIKIRRVRVGEKAYSAGGGK